MTSMAGMLTWLGWGVASVALLNVLTLVALLVAYAWHCGLKPRLQRRRARQHSFEWLLAQPSVGTNADPNLSGEPREW